MRTALYLFAFAALLSTASCSSRPDSPEATQDAAVVQEDTAADRTHVEAPFVPASDTPVRGDSTIGP